MKSSHGIIFTINGREIKTHTYPPPPRPTSAGPVFLFVDIYGPVCAVESLPVCEMRDSAVLRIAGLPKELGTGGGIDCQYFKLCRAFLWAQRGAIPGEKELLLFRDQENCFLPGCMHYPLPVTTSFLSFETWLVCLWLS